jgi:hypothetical protein
MTTERLGDQESLHRVEGCRAAVTAGGGAGHRAEFRGKVVEFDHAASAQDERLFDDVLQLTNVARMSSNVYRASSSFWSCSIWLRS